MSSGPLRRARRAIRHRALVVGFPVLAWLVALLGWRGAQTVGSVIGRIAWMLGGRERRRTLEHLALALPELDTGARRELARRCWRHLGANLGEVLVLAHRGVGVLEGRLEVVGAQHLEAAVASDRPVVLLTGHCGNWELLGAALGRLGIETWGIVRGMSNPDVEQLVSGFRARLGVKSIPRGSSAASRALLEVLRKPRALLALLVDQDFAGEGVMVPFFGHPAHTPVGPARLALRRGAIVVPGFDERKADGSHSVTFHAPLDLPADEVDATAAMTAAIEAQVRRVPEQWVWMHRRWRRGQVPVSGIGDPDQKLGN